MTLRTRRTFLEWVFGEPTPHQAMCARILKKAQKHRADRITAAQRLALWIIKNQPLAIALQKAAEIWVKAALENNQRLELTNDDRS